MGKHVLPLCLQAWQQRVMQRRWDRRHERAAAALLVSRLEKMYVTSFGFVLGQLKAHATAATAMMEQRQMDTNAKKALVSKMLAHLTEDVKMLVDTTFRSWQEHTSLAANIRRHQKSVQALVSSFGFQSVALFLHAWQRLVQDAKRTRADESVHQRLLSGFLAMNEHHLLQFAWQAFRQCHEDKRAKQKRGSMVTARLATQAMGGQRAALQAWHALAQSQLKVRQAALRFASALGLNVRQAAWSTWKRTAQRAKKLQYQLRMADNFLRRLCGNAARLGFWGWLQLTKQGKEMKVRRLS